MNISKKINYDKVPLPIRRFINSCASFYLFEYPYKKIKIIGVTGTNGKTTVATLLYKISMSLGHKAGLMSTVESFIGTKKVKSDLYKNKSILSKIFYSPTTVSTPEIWELKKLLSEMVNQGCEYVFMEVTSHGMEEKRVAGLKFAGAVFTNLTQDHLDYHKNMENYFQAKRKLFTTLPQRSFALVNTDDPYGIKMLPGTKALPFSYGIKKTFDDVHFHGEIKKLDFNGLDLAFNKVPITSKLLGKFNAYNLLAVWSTCSLLGFDMKKVNTILEKIEPPRGRFEHFVSPNGVVIIVDYAHTPDALENVLKTIHEIRLPENKIISVFGCGGDRDPIKRPIMGKIGASLSDVAIFTSDNPRSEDPNKIIHAMKGTLAHEELHKVVTISDRRMAIREAVKLAKKGDTILCAGKGHENYQEVNGVKNNFDDAEEFKMLFQQK